MTLLVLPSGRLTQTMAVICDRKADLSQVSLCLRFLMVGAGVLVPDIRNSLCCGEAWRQLLARWHAFGTGPGQVESDL